MVVNISQVLSEDWHYVTEDIRVVIDAAHAAARKSESDLRELLLERSSQDSTVPDLYGLGS